MATLRLRVELPTYNHSFYVVSSTSQSVRDLKHTIHHVCTGQPLVDAQRLIWRGRLLLDEERMLDIAKPGDDVITIHLSVRPGGWSSDPPDQADVSPPLPPPQPTSAPPLSVSQARPSIAITSTPTHDQLHSSRPQLGAQAQPVLSPPPNVHIIHPRHNPSPLSLEISQLPSQDSHLRSTIQPPSICLGYIAYTHQNALSALTTGHVPPVSSSSSELEAARTHAINHLAQLGWLWPPVFELPYPQQADEPVTAKYEQVVIEGQDYLRLIQNGRPTRVQAHALDILKCTFPLLFVPPLPSPPPIAQVVQNVNERLHELGVQVVRVQDQAIVADVRAINIRPLLLPLFLLFLRAGLLLWLFAPMRKPVITVAVALWFLYETWNTIRNAFVRPNVRQPPAAPAQPADRMPAQPQAAPRAVPEGGLDQPRGAARAGEQGVQPQQHRSYSSMVLESVSQLNLAEEDAALNGRVRESPRLGRRIYTFVCLLLFTAYPAYWDRRRARLRQREGQIRTEHRARETLDEPLAGSDETNEVTRRTNELRARARAELDAHHTRRADWVRAYVERVQREEWVDE